MNLCDTCKHWNGKRGPQYEGDTGEYRFGRCREIGGELDCYPYGGGASVDRIETPANFGCVLHEPTDESEGE